MYEYVPYIIYQNRILMFLRTCRHAEEASSLFAVFFRCSGGGGLGAFGSTMVLNDGSGAVSTSTSTSEPSSWTWPRFCRLTPLRLPCRASWLRCSSPNASSEQGDCCSCMRAVPLSLLDRRGFGEVCRWKGNLLFFSFLQTAFDCSSP